MSFNSCSRVSTMGRPVIGPGAKVLALEFNHPSVRGPAARILVEFKIEKMMVQGTVVY